MMGQLDTKDNFFTSKYIQVLLEHLEDEEIKGKLGDEMAVKLFCIEVLDKLLVSITHNYVPKIVLDVV